jgi:hemoglobin-like flavoprotein
MLNPSLLHRTYQVAVARQPKLAPRVFEILLARHPELAPLLDRGPASRVRQEQLLTDGLAVFLEHLEDSAWLTATLFALGARYVDLGVQEEMYPKFGDALLAALAEAAGPSWSDEVGAAWAEAYHAIADGLLVGAFAARAARTAA